MNALTALLAADHLNDLLREAEDERRLRLVRGARPTRIRRVFGLGPRIESIIDRVRGIVTRSSRPRPAGA